MFRETEGVHARLTEKDARIARSPEGEKMGKARWTKRRMREVKEIRDTEACRHA